jgi:transglutaminase-like putative cysteine protease
MRSRLLFLFRLSYHLLVLAGLLSQALTGILNPMVLTLGFGALAFSFFYQGLALSRGVGNAAALVALLFGALDYFILSRDLIIAAAHLLILMQAVKLFNLKHGRDYYQLYGLSFFGLISAAGLTSGLSFVFCFLFYLLMLTWTLILHHFNEEAYGADPTSEARWHASGAPLISPRFLITVSLVALFSFFMTLAFFYSIPRIGFGYLRSRHDRRSISGFSKTIDLGLFGPVDLDSTVVMRVELPQGRDALVMPQIHWRGMAFDYYNGQSWESRPTFRRLAPSGRDRFFQIHETKDINGVVEQIFFVEPLDIDVAFSIPGMVSLSGDFRYLKTNPMGTVEFPLLATRLTRWTYRVSSAITLTPDGRERHMIGLPGEDERDFSLQLPEDCERLRRLAQEITQNVDGDFQKTEVLETYLKRHYAYSLEVKRDPGFSPVDDFLFHQKEGYCEHFATAMALMVRALGIPARLISGFLGGEWNEFGKYYLLRQQDAHTWVEAYFPEMGWVTFDPTPARVEPKPLFPVVRGLFYCIDALRLRWNRYVINYRLSDQIRMVRMAQRRTIRLTDAGSDLLGVLQRSYHRWSQTTGLWPKILFYLAATGAGTGVLIAILKKWKRLKKSAPAADRPPIAVGFYRKMLKMMKAKGLSRPNGLTPLEFAQSVIRTRGPAYRGVMDITHLYNRRRFGREPISAPEMAHIHSILEDLKRLP